MVTILATGRTLPDLAEEVWAVLVPTGELERDGTTVVRGGTPAKRLLLLAVIARYVTFQRNRRARSSEYSDTGYVEETCGVPSGLADYMLLYPSVALPVYDRLAVYRNMDAETLEAMDCLGMLPAGIVVPKVEHPEVFRGWRYRTAG